MHVLVKPSVSKNPAKSVQPELLPTPCSNSNHPQYVIRALVLHHTQGMIALACPH